jgi:DNA-binding NtrC family response regulator
MNELKVLLVGQSIVLAEVIEPGLSALLPDFLFPTVVRPDHALKEMAAGGVIASIAFVQQASDETQVAALLHAVQARRAPVPMFVILSEGDVYQRLRFLELGALDCLSWPVDLSRVAALIDLLSVRRRVQPGPLPFGARLIPNAAQRFEPAGRVVAGFVFASRAMRELYDHIAAAAESNATVLLTGETGTGKSHVAKAIHELSRRRKKPFVVVECGGLSPTLLESELFGHVRGAFTGADREHLGKCATVADGTILLDEIDCVHLEAQAKLLRVFEDRVYEPVGANRTAKFLARVIAATNQPLERLVAEGKFRSDLFFRLNVVEFRLPPLRDCCEAIGPLAENFLAIYGQRAKRSMEGISPAALDAMAAYDWPGNIRELRNTIERAVTLCRHEVLEVEDLPDAIRSAAARAGIAMPLAVRRPLRNQLDSARQHGERQRILQALTRHNNNRTRAAKELGISRVALYKKLRKFGLVGSTA